MKVRIYQPQAIYEVGGRANQEDAIFPALGAATAADRLFILCDGMGGHEKGEVASQAVSRAMAEYIGRNADVSEAVDDDVLLAALEAACRALDALDDGAARKMGTTLCLMLFHRGGLTAMHVGDSRIYHIRPAEHRVLYQSRDHSLVYELFQAGEITYEQMRTSPQKNIITRAIQPGEDNRVRPAIVHIADIRAGDYFYMCSDGMLERMENSGLCALLSADTTDESKREALVAATAANADNHSAYLVHIADVAAEPGDDSLADDEQASRDNAVNILPPAEATADVAVEAAGGSQAGDDAVKVVGLSPRRKLRGGRFPWLLAGIVAVGLAILALFARPLLTDKSVAEKAAPTPGRVIVPVRQKPVAKAAARAKMDKDKKAKTAATAAAPKDTIKAAKDSAASKDGLANSLKSVAKARNAQRDSGDKGGSNVKPDEKTLPLPGTKPGKRHGEENQEQSV